MRGTNPILFALALLHAALALCFASAAPWRTPGISNGLRLADIGAPDEVAHANYVDHLLAGRGLPVLHPATAATSATYEDHQPPLFYLLDAALGRLMGVTRVEPPSAQLPLRAVNAGIGALTVFATFLFARAATGRPRVALAASAVVALLPMNLALSGAVSNDPLLIALTTAALAIGTLGLRAESLLCAAGLGLVVGLAILTKFTGLLLLPVIPCFVRRERLALAWGVAIVVAGPWLLRNELVYGHPLAANAFNATFSRDVDLALLQTPRGLAHWAYVLLAGTAESGLGEFGYMDIPLPNAVAFPLIAALAGCLLAGFGQTGVNTQVRRATRLLLGLLALGYLSYNLWQVQPQARYLFPSLAPMALMVVLGGERLFGRRVPVAVAFLLAGLLFADAVALAILPREFAIRAERARAESSKAPPLRTKS